MVFRIIISLCPGCDFKLHPMGRLQFGSFEIIGKVELPFNSYHSQDHSDSEWKHLLGFQLWIKKINLLPCRYFLFRQKPCSQHTTVVGLSKGMRPIKTCTKFSSKSSLIKWPPVPSNL